MSVPIDFVGLARALLDRAPELVRGWLPNGVERNGRWYIGSFDGEPGESANVNLSTGQWIDNGAPEEDVGNDLTSLYARINNLGQAAAARELMRLLGWERSQASAQPPARERPPQLAEGEATTVPRHAPGKSKWVPVVPVPAHAPAPPKFVFPYKDSKQGDRWIELLAVRHWEWRFNGVFYGYTARFERIDSKGLLDKQVLPFTWCTDSTDGRGASRWHRKQWDEPRPLYVPAGALSERSPLAVVVVEGEKKADRGRELLGDEFDFVAWPGGCKAWHLAAWEWLQGRTVYLWPDVDMKREALTKEERAKDVDPESKPIRPESKQGGMQAMVGIGSRLLASHGCTVLMCQVPKPGEVKDGWDIVDAVDEDGWDVGRLRDFIRAAVPFVSPDASANAKAAGDKQARSGADAGPVEDDAEAWRKALIVGGKGATLPVRENVVAALDGWPARSIKGIPDAAGLVAFNEFTNNVTKLRPTPWGSPAGDWQEADELRMGEWLVREHWLPSMARGTLEEAVLMVASRHAFHPVRRELEGYSGTWDQEKRLGTWLVKACMEEAPADDGDVQYLARVGTWLVMAICARVMTPGCKFDYMTIFEGPQGWGKSTLARVLGGDYFADTGLVLGEKDSYQNLQGILVYEWGELDSLTRTEVTKVKQFVSSQKDRFRASFDRRPRDYPRQVVFIGTTNEDHYLTDPTGNRRFWPVRLTRPVDVAWVRSVRQQLFAEALHYLELGERFHPTQREQRDLFDPQQQLRTVDSAIEQEISTYLYDEDQKVPHGGFNGAFVNSITLSDLLGWKTGRPGAAKTGATRARMYLRPPERDAAGKERPTAGPIEERPDDGCPF